MNHTRHVGELLREWRQRRRLTQLDLAGDAEISTKHLSFMETGRSIPSREMLGKLIDVLQIPLRDRNDLFLTAGFAPVFMERAFDDPELGSARDAIDLILKGHEPYPALVIDRHWNMLAANSSVGLLLAGVDPELLRPPINALRLSLHARGLAPMIVNLAQWRDHLLTRLRRQAGVASDPALDALIRELQDYPAPRAVADEPAKIRIAMPLRLRTPAGILNLISTTTVFGTPMDVTLSELALESFFPGDAATASALREMAANN